MPISTEDLLDDKLNKLLGLVVKMVCKWTESHHHGIQRVDFWLGCQLPAQSCVGARLFHQRGTREQCHAPSQWTSHWVAGMCNVTMQYIMVHHNAMIGWQLYFDGQGCSA